MESGKEGLTSGLSGTQTKHIAQLREYQNHSTLDLLCFPSGVPRLSAKKNRLHTKIAPKLFQLFTPLKTAMVLKA